MPTGKQTSCYTKQYLSTNGSLVENQDGSVSIFVRNTQNVLAPVFLTSYCCEVLGYTFDANNQKCLWSAKSKCSIENSFNIELNPVGNSSVIFNVGSNESCQLNVEFDYLFKIKCETLNKFLLESQNSTEPTYDPDVLIQIINLQGEIQNQETECSAIQNTINFLTDGIKQTPYSIFCSIPISQSNVALPNSSNQIMGSTAFGNTTSEPTRGPQVIQPITPNIGHVNNQTFCISEPDGLSAWATILGAVNYENFINGDPTSYGCDEVSQLYEQSQTAVATGGQPLLSTCTIPFGTRTQLEVNLANSLQQQIDCNNVLQTLYSQLATLTATQETQVVKCGDPIDMFETLDVSMTLSVYSGGTYVVVYEDNTLFPAIGAGNLYNYLTERSPSGFYVCGGSDCQPMYLNTGQFIGENTTTCDAVAENLTQALFNQSGLQNTSDDITIFTDSLPTDSFNSDWLSFNTDITDPVVLSAITNQKIKINLKLNHTCGDICILMDNIKLNKNCSTTSNTNIFVTECLGFKLEKIIDNKKSWLANTTPVNRDFRVFNANGLYPIRQTNYDIDNERLIINTKEIDLDINIAAAIETDVWCYIVDNPCLLTGQTTCEFICEGQTIPKSCPSGYTLSLDGTQCIGFTNVPATGVGITFTAETAGPDLNWNSNGAIFHENITNKIFPISITGASFALPVFAEDNGTGSTLTVEATVLNNLWGSGTTLPYNRGRLNNIGIWATTGTTISADTFIGFSFCFDAPATAEYCIGISGDNYIKAKLNGITIIDVSPSNNNPNLNYRTWNVFPITLSGGTNIIELEGANDNTGAYPSPNPAGFGAEVYNVPVSILSGLTTISQLEPYIIFTTSGKTGSTYTTFTCPDGFAFNTCDGSPSCSIQTTIPSSATSCYYTGTTCGDLLDFNALLTQPLSAVTVLEDFQYHVLSELIDAKNRQTISAYPTLRALYDRYIESTTYCAAQSSAFDYYTMDKFANLVGNYWVDIIEQVIPATTIWGSIKVYTNTIFDQQKFKYKSYTSLLCGNVFSGDTVLSPINGTSGQCQTVEVITQNISLSGQTPIRVVKPQLSSCGSLCLAQMNHGSEFIGGVSTISVTPTSCTVQGTVIVDCSLGVTITTQGLTATANVVNGTAPIYYDWSNGATGQTTTFPSIGKYYLTVSDGNCCNIRKEVVIT